jgi:transcriptional regulator with XRE-family HTH domain
MIDVSPAYLSRIERELLHPPSEEKILAIAGALDQNPDELLALAGRVASDLPEIIRRRPREIAKLLRTSREAPLLGRRRCSNSNAASPARGSSTSAISANATAKSSRTAQTTHCAGSRRR